MKLSAQTVIQGAQVAAVGVVGFLLYKLVSKGKDTVDKGTTAAADAYLTVEDAFTDYETAQVAGRAVLPNGQRIALSQLTLNPDASFRYGGVLYKLTKRRSDNDYDAVKVS